MERKTKGVIFKYIIIYTNKSKIFLSSLPGIIIYNLQLLETLFPINESLTNLHKPESFWTKKCLAAIVISEHHKLACSSWSPVTWGSHSHRNRTITRGPIRNMVSVVHWMRRESPPLVWGWSRWFTRHARVHRRTSLVILRMHRTMKLGSRISPAISSLMSWRRPNIILFPVKMSTFHVLGKVGGPVIIGRWRGWWWNFPLWSNLLIWLKV